MPYMDDLFKSMGMFKDGMQQLAVSQGINDATNEINGLKSKIDEQTGQAMTVMQQNSEQKRITQQLAARMTSANAQPQQVAQMVQNFTPPEMKSSADFQQAMARAGSAEEKQQYLKLATDQQKLENDAFTSSETAKLIPHQAGDLAKIRETGIEARKTDAAKAALDKKAAGGSALAKGEIDDLKALDVSLKSGETILSNKNLDKYVGPSNSIPGMMRVSAIKDPKYASFIADVGRNFDKYKKEVTGVAGAEKEMAKLEANTPNINDTPEAFRLKQYNILAAVASAKIIHLDNLSEGGRNVAGYSAAYKRAQQALAKYEELAGGSSESPAPQGLPKGTKTSVEEVVVNGLPTKQTFYTLPSGTKIRAKAK